MKTHTNVKVFCFLRIIELLLSCFCFAIHIYGVLSLKEEPLPHDVICCGTFMGFILVSSFAIMHQSVNVLKYRIETVSSVIGFILFITTSICAMINVENDVDLHNMTELEEKEHPFFKINRLQSVSSLITGIVFLLHATFAIEFVLNKPLETDEVLLTKKQLEEKLKLYFFPEIICKQMILTFKKYLNYFSKR